MEFPKCVYNHVSRASLPCLNVKRVLLGPSTFLNYSISYFLFLAMRVPICSYSAVFSHVVRPVGLIVSWLSPSVTLPKLYCHSWRSKSPSCLMSIKSKRSLMMAYAGTERLAKECTLFTSWLKS